MPFAPPIPCRAWLSDGFVGEGLVRVRVGGQRNRRAWNYHNLSEDFASRDREEPLFSQDRRQLPKPWTASDKGPDACAAVGMRGLSGQNAMLSEQLARLSERVAGQDERIAQLERRLSRSSPNSSRPPSWTGETPRSSCVSTAPESSHSWRRRRPHRRACAGGPSRASSS